MNPVLKKDVLGLLRLARIALVLVAFVGLLSVLVLATWPQQGLVPLATQGQDTLLMALVLGQLLVMILAVPGVAAVQLTEEKESNTLEMLYATRLRPVSIIAGKLGSTLCFPVLLLLAGLPFVALLNYRGDVDVAQLLEAYGVLVLTAMLLALLSLAISALCESSATALVVAYLVVLGVCGAVLVPALVMLDNADPTVGMALHYLRSVSPIAAAMSILRPGVNDFGGLAGGNLPAWMVFGGFAVLLIVVSAGIVISRLARPPVDADARAGGQSEEARTLGRKMMFLIDDKKQRKPIGSLNPLFAKERRTNQLRSGRWMIRIFYGALVAALALALMGLYGGIENGNVLSYVGTVIASLQFAVLALVTPSLASPVISTELEADTFEMLRMTRLGGGKIFWGKFVPALLPALLPVVAIVPAWIVLCALNAEYIRYVLDLVPITLLALVMCSTIALACSSLSQSSARATVLSYLIVAIIFLVPMIAWWLAGVLLAPALARQIAVLSPLVVALDIRPGQATVPLTRGLAVTHMILVAAISLTALLIARFRLRQLMRQG